MMLVGMLIVIGIYGLDKVMQISLQLSTPGATDILWMLQFISTTIPLLIAPVVFSYLIVKEPQAYLRTNAQFPWGLMVLVLFIMFVSLPLIEWLGNINKHMILPFKGLQDWMQEKEDAAQKMVAVLLEMKTIGSLIKNVLLVGLLTAIAEEFIFRGVIQTIFTRWTKSTNWAIWITAIIFSAIHFQFFGFLPRMILGVLLGYLVVWSGSIWPAVWAHFINNGTGVVAMYLYQHKKIALNPEAQHMFDYKSYLFSLIIVVFLLLMYRYIATGKKPLGAN